MSDVLGGSAPDTGAGSAPPGDTPARPGPNGIRVRGLGLRFGAQVVFADLSFAIADGEFVALLGESGVGKSSLLKIIAGLAAATTGSVTGTDGQPIAGRIAYMGQQDLLLPWLTVAGNVTLGARLRGEPADGPRARHLLERVGLAGRHDALPAALSGGMRQRAALARTLYERRPILLLDEPFSALDAITRARVQDLAAELLADRTVLLITHDPAEACRLGHRLLVLTGSPARLGTPLVMEGRSPRAPDDPRVLRGQTHLLRLFAGAP